MIILRAYYYSKSRWDRLPRDMALIQEKGVSKLHLDTPFEVLVEESEEPEWNFISTSHFGVVTSVNSIR